MIVDRITSITSLPEIAEHSISHQNWVKAPEVNAGFSIRHNGSSIFLFYKVEEPQVRAVNTAYNSSVWEDSCVEFFLSMEGDDSYYNFEINAIGTVLGAYGLDRHERYHISDRLLSQITTIPSLGKEPLGQANRYTSWNIQVKIPIETLSFSVLEDFSGRDAHANFYKCGDKLKHPHFLSWKPVLTSKPDFHQPHYFGQLSFL
jgi:Carbohydrate-binding family 9